VDWLYNLFFAGDYPLALQLAVLNTVCMVVALAMRSQKSYKRAPEMQARSLKLFAWLAICANFMLILNKDYRFIQVLA
jgi:heme/copper-type cytochrome/quinol oxidase subunit 1